MSRSNSHIKSNTRNIAQNNNQSFMKRSVSPILSSNHSIQNLSSNPSFMNTHTSNNRQRRRSKGNPIGGAVQEPRKKKSISRSKSKTT